MSRNGNGQYTLPAGNPVVPGTTVATDWANNTMSDIATALTGSVASDGQTPMTGNLDMSNNRIVGVTNGINPQDAATVNQLANAAITGGTINGAVIGGTDPKDGTFTNLTATVSATAPTVTPPNDSSTKVATTAFVQNAIAAVSSGVTSFNTRSGAVVLQSADVTTALGYTPLNPVSPAMTGVPTAPTAPNGTDTTQIATTAFVLANAGGGAVSSVNGKTGAVVLSAADVGAYPNSNPSAYTTLAAVAAQGYTTQAWVQSQGYVTTSALSNYVTTNTTQSITGAKTFSTGITAPTFLINSTLGMLSNGQTLNLKAGTHLWNFQSDSSSVNPKNSPNWDVSSDIRIKQNIVPVSNAMDKIMALKPVFYEYKNAPSTERAGFVAQEYVEVFPEAACQITTPPDLAQYVNNEPTVLGISIDLNAYYVKTIQELNERLIALEAQVQALAK